MEERKIGMFSMIIIIATVLLVISLARRVYFQSLLEKKAKFNFAPVLGGVLILGFLSPLLKTLGNSLVFDMLLTSLVILTFISGRNGLTTKGILLPNLVTKLLDFQKIGKVSVTPVDVATDQNLFLATFFEKQSARPHALVFEMSLSDLVGWLKKRLPDETEIEA